MDDGVVQESFNEQQSVGELFWTLLPSYLAIGMTAEEFWHGEPKLAAAYREAEYIRHDNRLYAEWRAGRYVYEALLCAAPLYQTFSKSHRAIDFPEEPIFRLSSDNEEHERQVEKAHMEKNITFMETFMVSHNMNLEQAE